VVGEPFGAVA